MIAWAVVRVDSDAGPEQDAFGVIRVYEDRTDAIVKGMRLNQLSQEAGLSSKYVVRQTMYSPRKDDANEVH